MANRSLLLIAHGSSHQGNVEETVHRHAAALGAVLEGVPCRVAFLNGSPGPADALAELPDGRVDVVPFFMERGYFTGTVVPRALADAARARPGQHVVIHDPVGTDASVTDAILSRVVAAGARQGIAPAELSLILVGHGSARSPGRRLSLHDHADGCRRAGLFRTVHAACLEEPPFVADVVAGLPDGPVAFLGLFAGRGTHVLVDMPALIAAARMSRTDEVIDAGSIGDDDGMQAIILRMIGADDAP